MNSENSFELAQFCCQVLMSRKAEEMLVLDLQDIESAPANYFVLCTGTSEVHVKALTDALLRGIRNAGMERPRLEGDDAYEWVLIDFFDVVVHIFQEDTREFYNLEKLWGDANMYSPDEEGQLEEVGPVNQVLEEKE